MSQNKNDTIEFPSLEFAFELTKERIADQFDQRNALDTKANVMLGSATAIVSSALVLQAVLLPSYCSIIMNKFLRGLPLLMLLLVYLLVLTFVIFAYKIRDYKLVPDPKVLYEEYLRVPEEHTKADVFRAMVEAFKHNDKIIKNKASWIRYSFIALACEAVLLVVFLSLQLVC